MGKLHPARCILQYARTFRLLHLRRLLYQRKNTRCARKRVLKLRKYAGNLIKGLGVLVGIAQKAGKRSHGDTADSRDKPSDGRKCSRYTDTGVYKAVDKPCGRIRQGGKESRIQGIFCQLFIDFIKAGQRLVFIGKSLHHLLISYHFIYQRRLLAPRLRLQLKHFIGSSGNKRRHKKTDRRNADHHQRDAHILPKHKEQCAQNRDNPRKKLGKSHNQAIRKLVYIGNHTAYNFSVRMGIQIF